MNIIDHSAQYLARSIRRNYPEAGSETALTYSLSLVINSSISFFISLVFCLFIGHLYECLIAICSFIILRFFSGGLHMSSSLSCCILSTSIIVIASLMTYEYSYYYMLIDFLTCLILLRTAPNGINNVSRIDPKYYPFLKMIAVALVCSNLIGQSTVITSAFLIQALLTTKPAYRLKFFLEGR